MSMGRTVLGLGLSMMIAALAGCATSDSRGPQAEPPAARQALIDRPVADFRLQDITRDEPDFVSLSHYRGKVLVLFFMSYQCNTSKGYEGRIVRILNDYKGRNVDFVGVRSSVADTNEATRQYVREKFRIPVLGDEGSTLAGHFKVSNTPTFVVIDPQGRFRYWGAFDDHYDEKRARKQYLREAIDAALAGGEVATKRGLGLG